MRSSGAPSAVSDDDDDMKISVSPPPPLEESSQGLHGVFLGPSPPVQVIHLLRAPGLPRRRCFSAPLHQENHITPRAVSAVFSSVLVAHHKLFCPVLMSQLGLSWVRPDPSLKMIRASVQGCETPRLFSCGAWALLTNSNGHRPQHCSGKVTRDLPLQDIPESALDEYCQIMDDLGLKVTEESEVTDECVQYINQLLDDSQFMTEATLDMNFISYLLSSDVLKDDLEVFAGCSDWTSSTDSEAPPSDGQRDSRPFNRTGVPITENPMMKNMLAPFQDTVEDLTVSQMFTEPEGQHSQTDLNTSVQETLHPDLQDRAPETDYK